MILLDTMLIGGIRFVLDKLASAVDAEMNNEERLREELLAAQMRLELGEMTDDEFAAFERGVLQRLREIQSRKRGEAPSEEPGRYTLAGVETTFDDDATHAPTHDTKRTKRTRR